MSQFKRFNTSENNSFNSSDAFPEGTLTWDSSNGLRLHDGNTGGGNAVGGISNYYDLTNRPSGNTAVHDLQGGSSSLLNGYFLKQTNTGVSEWTALPTTYDTLTIDTKIIGGIDGAAGTQITGIEASLGSGVPYRYAFLGGNDAFGDLFNRGSSIIGWKMYPASDPSAFVTITEFLNNDLGAPSLGFSGSLGQGPWIAESSDYNAGTDGPLTLSAGTSNFVLGTDGSLTFPGEIKVIGNGTASATVTNEDGVVGAPSGAVNITGAISSNPQINTIQPGWLVTGSNLTATTTVVSVVETSPGFYTITTDDSSWPFAYGVEYTFTEPVVSTWTFGGNGDLTLPAGGDIVDSNGDSVIVTDVNQLADSSGLLPAAQVRYVTKNADFTAEAGKIYWLDSGSSAKTMTLPANPTTGDWVKVYDGSLNWQTYNLTVNGNGNNVRTINMGGGMTWNSPASTATLNQQMISPVGPFPASFIWNGSVWSGAM